MTRVITNKAASIRAKIENISRKEKIDFDYLLLRYLQERFLYRLANSDYSDNFILKGGLLLIGLDMPKSRPTKDMDFLAERINNNIAELESSLKEIVSISCDDGVKFDQTSITSERITEDADYEGIRLKIDGKLGQARKRIQIDVGFGDIVTPSVQNMKFPSILGEELTQIRVYSIESIISEKFEAMVKLVILNSRMKDFYDVFMLSKTHDFQGKTLKKAIEATFKVRKTDLPDNPLVFKEEFHKSEDKQKQWTAFLRKTKLKDTSEAFNVVMERITDFLKPVVFSIKNGTDIDRIWDKSHRKWKE